MPNPWLLTRLTAETEVPTAFDHDTDAGVSHTLGTMRPGWIVVRHCCFRDRTAGHLPAAPVTIRCALVHPNLGIALLSVSPDARVPDAAGRLRRALDTMQFRAIFGGWPPIVYQHLTPRELPKLDSLLAKAFAGPPLSLHGGNAWVGATLRVLTCGAPSGAGAPAAGAGASGSEQRRGSGRRRIERADRLRRPVYGSHKTRLVFWGYLLIPALSILLLASGGAVWLRGAVDGPPLETARLASPTRMAATVESQAPDRLSSGAAVALAADASTGPVVPAAPVVSASVVPPTNEPAFLPTRDALPFSVTPPAPKLAQADRSDPVVQVQPPSDAAVADSGANLTVSAPTPEPPAGASEPPAAGLAPPVQTVVGVPSSIVPEVPSIVASATTPPIQSQPTRQSEGPAVADPDATLVVPGPVPEPPAGASEPPAVGLAPPVQTVVGVPSSIVPEVPSAVASATTPPIQSQPTRQLEGPAVADPDATLVVPGPVPEAPAQASEPPAAGLAPPDQTVVGVPSSPPPEVPSAVASATTPPIQSQPTRQLEGPAVADPDATLVVPGPVPEAPAQASEPPAAEVAPPVQTVVGVPSGTPPEVPSAVASATTPPIQSPPTRQSQRLVVADPDATLVVPGPVPEAPAQASEPPDPALTPPVQTVVGVPSSTPPEVPSAVASATIPPIRSEPTRQSEGPAVADPAWVAETPDLSAPSMPATLPPSSDVAPAVPVASTLPAQRPITRTEEPRRLGSLAAGRVVARAAPERPMPSTIPAISMLVRPTHAPLATALRVAGSVGERCRAITLKVQLGEEPSNAERDYLRNGCRGG